MPSTWPAGCRFRSRNTSRSTEALDVELLKRCCLDVAREFESGYVRIIEVDGEPWQLIDFSEDPVVISLDFTDRPDAEARAREWMTAEYSTPVDLNSNQLMTAATIKIGPDRYFWYLRMHHIVGDGFAGITLVNRMAELYTAAVEGTALSPSKAGRLADVVQADIDYRASDKFTADGSYWIEHLRGLPAPVTLAGRTAPPTAHPRVVSGALPDETSALLNAAAAGVPPVIIAAFAAYLARLTATTEVTLSLPVAARTSAVLKRSAGMVANVVPLRLAISGDLSIDELVHRTMMELTGALRRPRYRQEDMFRDLGLTGDDPASFGPSINLMMFDSRVVLGPTEGRVHVLTSGLMEDLFLNLYPAQGGRREHRSDEGARSGPSTVRADTAQGGRREHRSDEGARSGPSTVARSTVRADTAQGGRREHRSDEGARSGPRTVRADAALGHASTHVDFQANPELYTESELTTHHARFLAFLDRFLRAPGDSRVADVSVLEPDERAAIVPARGVAGVPALTLPEILARGVARSGGNPAVESAERSMSYAELDAASSQLARLLIQRGARPETHVVVAIARSIESIIAVWAVAKTGAAFVPVDPKYPPDRILHMITDSGSTLGVTVAVARDGLPDDLTWLVLDAPSPSGDADLLRSVSSAAMTDADRLAPVRVTNTAYVIYTSGSTGLPKGVRVTHAGLENLIQDRTRAYGISADTRLSHAYSPSFDASLEQFLVGFANGATFVIIPPDIVGGEPLTSFIEEQQINHIDLPPAMLSSMDSAKAPSLRSVVVGGDVCQDDLVSRWQPGRTMHNAYGPTEVTISSTATTVEPDTAVTIGKPMQGVTAVVLDTQLHPVPIGVDGRAVSGRSCGGARLREPAGHDGFAVRRRSVRRAGFADVPNG